MKIGWKFNGRLTKIGRKFDRRWTDVRWKSNELSNEQKSNIVVAMAMWLHLHLCNSLCCSNGGWHEMGNATLIVVALQNTHGFRDDDQWQRSVATRDSANATSHDAAKDIGRNVASSRHYNLRRSDAITNITRLHLTSRWRCNSWRHCLVAMVGEAVLLCNDGERHYAIL